MIDEIIIQDESVALIRQRGDHFDRAHSRFHARFATVARDEKAIFLNCSHRPDL